MTEPSDSARLALTVLFAAWVVVFAYAFVAYATTSHQGAGTSKLGAFLGWQGVAGMLAVAVFGVSRKWSRGSPVRRIGYVPLGLALGITAAIAGAGKLLP